MEMVTRNVLVKRGAEVLKGVEKAFSASDAQSLAAVAAAYARLADALGDGTYYES